MGTFSLVKAVLTIQLFYAFAITMLVYAMPAYDVANIALYQDPAADVNISTVQSQIESSTQQQLDVPLIDLGSLAFYSGNIIVDMMLNFLFAIPQMFTLLIGSFTMFLPLNSVLQQQVQNFVSIFVSVMYFLGILAFIMSIRTQGNVV